MVKLSEFLNLPEPPETPANTTSKYFVPKIPYEFKYPVWYTPFNMGDFADLSPSNQVKLAGTVPFLGYVSQFMNGKLKLRTIIVEKDG